MKSKDSIFWGKCVLYHYNDPYLKLGPFSVEISNADPPRFVLHKVKIISKILLLKYNSIVLAVF